MKIMKISKKTLFPFGLILLETFSTEEKKTHADRRKYVYIWLACHKKGMRKTFSIRYCMEPWLTKILIEISHKLIDEYEEKIKKTENIIMKNETLYSLTSRHEYSHLRFINLRVESRLCYIYWLHFPSSPFCRFSF